MIAQCHGILYGLHWEGMSLDVLVAEEVGRATHGEHQVVVVDGADRGVDSLLFDIDVLDLGHPAEILLIALEDAAERKGDLCSAPILRKPPDR